VDPTVRRILCPIDLTASAAEVVDWAIHMAEECQGQVVLLHAYRLPFELQQIEGACIPDPFWRELREDAERELHAWADRVRRAGVPVSDLVARMGYKGPSYEALYAADYHIGKTARDNVKEYLRRSPVSHAGKLKTPLLIHTNTNDEDVNVLEVERLIAALKAAGHDLPLLARRLMQAFLRQALRDDWRAPVAAARSALEAALEIEHEVENVRFGDGIQLRTRIGISTGLVVGGTVGGGERLGYTVHGDTVNLAARLEALNKDLGTTILVSSRTAALLPETIRLRDLGAIEVRGFAEPLSVYEPLARTGAPVRTTGSDQALG